MHGRRSLLLLVAATHLGAICDADMTGSGRCSVNRCESGTVDACNPEKSTGGLRICDVVECSRKAGWQIRFWGSGQDHVGYEPQEQ